MDKEIYSFTDYRLYIKCKIYNGDRARRGELSSLAVAIPCQTSYLSRVMSGESDLSLEQADCAGRHLGLSQDENSYFLLLVQYSRAGTQSLRAHFKRNIATAQEERLSLHKRVGVKQVLSKEDQATYYSLWYYAAVHVMTGIPALQTKSAMAQELGLPANKLAEILEFLVNTGLVKEVPDGRYHTGEGKLHLKKDSRMILRHHSNWRTQAIRSMEKDLESGIHYSVLLNCSKKDANILRSMIAKFIQDFMNVVHPSSDEEMNCLVIDFFNPKA
ncbi:MAG: TIGR02147 family protein [Bacteriovorax sp.]|nr:TIGR02147 family protein [Bacteriovorax sp.]